MDLSASYRLGYMRDCIYRCYNVAQEDSQSKNPILHHWEMTSPGYNYHFCAVHRVYHCMATSSRVDQPCCGECAPAYYSQVPEVTWIRENDYHFSFYSVPPEFLQMMTGGAVRGDACGPAVRLATIFPLPSDVPDHGSALEAVPRHDVTYRELGSNLMAHRRHAGLFLMRFIDYDGLPGWLLCGRSMTQESFAHLAEAEHNGDNVMKSARLWACQQLGCTMPQDVRWILWSIYMLASKALANPLPTEQEAWMWRSWLWYWYTKANELAAYYQMDILSPDEDWFNRPPSDVHPVSRPCNGEAAHDASAAQRDASTPSDRDDIMDQSFVASDSNGEDDASKDAASNMSGSATNQNHSESPGADSWSTESSSTETSSFEMPSSEAAVRESSLSMTGLATTLASIDEDEDSEADADQ
ncbi:hypothetical protein V8C34DRAFT_324382 [Trichoderma compactum]